MKAKVLIFPSEAQPSERASERTALPEGGWWQDHLQILRLEKMLFDMEIGMRNLRAIWPKPWNYNARELAQAAKIRSVEAKLFKVRQGRLL